jgi:hypothetical protein
MSLRRNGRYSSRILRVCSCRIDDILWTIKKIISYLGGNGAHRLAKMSFKPPIFYGLGIKYKNNGKITYIKEYKCDCAW